MSHNGDKSSLSQPLRVETEDNNSNADDNTYFEEVKENYNHNGAEDSDSLGPLPPKWEKAYTESGEVYFIE